MYYCLIENSNDVGILGVFQSETFGMSKKKARKKDQPNFTECTLIISPFFIVNLMDGNISMVSDSSNNILVFTSMFAQHGGVIYK